MHCLPVPYHEADGYLISVEVGQISSPVRGIICLVGSYFYQMNPPEKKGLGQKPRNPLKMTVTLE